MILRIGFVLGVFLIMEAAALGFETQDLKGSESLQKMQSVWGPVEWLRDGGAGVVDNWKAIDMNHYEGRQAEKAAAVKNSSGEFLYMVKRNDNEIVMTFVSFQKVLFFPPFDFYVDKKHIFDARQKDMLPIMAGQPSEYSGFSIYLNKDYENPGANEALQAFVNGSQAVVEFFSVENEIAQAVFSLKGSKMAIMEMLMAE